MPWQPSKRSAVVPVRARRAVAQLRVTSPVGLETRDQHPGGGIPPNCGALPRVVVFQKSDAFFCLFACRRGCHCHAVLKRTDHEITSETAEFRNSLVGKWIFVTPRPKIVHLQYDQVGGKLTE